MSSEVVAKIVTIAHDENSDGYVVEFWVGQELAEKPTLNEAFALLGSMDTLQREIYSFVVQWEDGDFTMEPDEALAECLAIFDKHDSAEGLGSPLRPPMENRAGRRSHGGPTRQQQCLWGLAHGKR